ncbi:MAG: copper-binding protein [Ramlibacter sp.]
MSGMSGHDHHAAAPVAKPVAAKGTEMSEGEVRKVDTERRKITLKHGPLKNLDMPPMTMAFQVTDVAMLNKVKAGDKVRFVAANPDGKLTLTEIRLAE